MKIAMLASEANPLCKTGGLADVVFALSKELRKKKDEVIVVLPFYLAIGEKGKGARKVDSFDVQMGWRHNRADIYRLDIEGIPYYLVDNDRYFGARPALYGYDDDGERFAFYALAAMAFIHRLDFHPDILHCHDWQAGMVPAIKKCQYGKMPDLSRAKTVMTIHNPAFKGMLDPYALGDLYNLPESLFSDGTARFEGKVSTLKCGIVMATKVTTVSPTHREELLTPELSQGLCNVLRLREYDFCGFVNGIDAEEWNPSKDPRIPFPFDGRSIVSGKAKNKAALQQSLQLDRTDGPLFGLVSRLTCQKGIDLVLSLIPEIVRRGGQVVILGSGEYELEEKAKVLATAFPRQVKAEIRYSDALAHAIYAGSDFFLMPSLFEPCGIGQLLAERYASIPVARDTGGLHDTISDYRGGNEDVANGILFRDYGFDGLRYGVDMAFRAYKDKKVLAKLRKNAYKADHSWARSAELYQGLYRAIV